MEYEIIDNYLEIDDYKKLYTTIVESDTSFPWYKTNGVAHYGGLDGYYFIHYLYNDFTYSSDKFSLIEPILNKINPFSLVRIKINFYPATKEIEKHGWHKDYEISHKAAVYYLNDNDGKTIFDNGVEVDSVANRILFFDGSISHRSTTCTNHNTGRYTINFNYV